VGSLVARPVQVIALARGWRSCVLDDRGRPVRCERQ